MPRSHLSENASFLGMSTRIRCRNRSVAHSSNEDVSKRVLTWKHHRTHSVRTAETRPQDTIRCFLLSSRRLEICLDTLRICSDLRKPVADSAQKRKCQSRSRQERMKNTEVKEVDEALQLCQSREASTRGSYITFSYAGQ